MNTLKCWVLTQYLPNTCSFSFCYTTPFLNYDLSFPSAKTSLKMTLIQSMRCIKNLPLARIIPGTAKTTGSNSDKTLLLLSLNDSEGRQETCK